jgi:hypothetical protein
MSNKITTGPEIALALAMRAGLEGVAFSQVSMGHWTPEFYAERCRVIKDKWRPTEESNPEPSDS